jgi:Holliday junction resolvase-like predicted endonuclease
MRIEERDKAAEDLKSAVHKVQAEAEDKMKKQTEVYLKQQREQKEFITKLQVLIYSSCFSQRSAD